MELGLVLLYETWYPPTTQACVEVGRFMESFCCSIGSGSDDPSIATPSVSFRIMGEYRHTVLESGPSDGILCFSEIRHLSTSHFTQAQSLRGSFNSDEKHIVLTLLTAGAPTFTTCNGDARGLQNRAKGPLLEITGKYDRRTSVSLLNRSKLLAQFQITRKPQHFPSISFVVVAVVLSAALDVNAEFIAWSSDTCNGAQGLLQGFSKAERCVTLYEGSGCSSQAFTMPAAGESCKNVNTGCNPDHCRQTAPPPPSRILEGVE
ncbi:hypothetical protein C8J56DRAFT_1115238 [Mycena floridula]|nr:hypothetical protein C8J56DRAFT_1115238 [Mycena floridula]